MRSVFVLLCIAVLCCNSCSPNQNLKVGNIDEQVLGFYDSQIKDSLLDKNCILAFVDSSCVLCNIDPYKWKYFIDKLNLWLDSLDINQERLGMYYVLQQDKNRLVDVLFRKVDWKWKVFYNKDQAIFDNMTQPIQYFTIKEGRMVMRANAPNSILYKQRLLEEFLFQSDSIFSKIRISQRTLCTTNNNEVLSEIIVCNIGDVDVVISDIMVSCDCIHVNTSPPYYIPQDSTLNIQVQYIPEAGINPQLILIANIAESRIYTIGIQ